MLEIPSKSNIWPSHKHNQRHLQQHLEIFALPVIMYLLLRVIPLESVVGLSFICAHRRRRPRSPQLFSPKCPINISYKLFIPLLCHPVSAKLNTLKCNPLPMPSRGEFRRTTELEEPMQTKQSFAASNQPSFLIPYP